jgi:DNA-binding NarL/FixJ family response regulator
MLQSAAPPSPTRATNILVVDAHSVYRRGLREVIEARVQGSNVFDAPSLSDLGDNNRFDLILIDAESLTRHSLALLKKWHDSQPDTRFAVMSASSTRADVFDCLSAGFHGYIYKLQSDEELLMAVNDLLSGRIFVPRWLVDEGGSMPEVPTTLNVRPEMLKLTPRQNDVLPLLAQGMSTKEIARHLRIAEGTTKIHIAALLKALSARNRTEAAFMAAKLVASSARFENRSGHGLRIMLSPDKTTENNESAFFERPGAD